MALAESLEKLRRWNGRKVYSEIGCSASSHNQGRG